MRSCNDRSTVVLAFGDDVSLIFPFRARRIFVLAPLRIEDAAATSTPTVESDRMSSIIQSLTSMIKPDMIGTIGKTFGVDTSKVEQAIGAAGPLLLGSLARAANSAGGADALLKTLPTDTDGLFGSLGNIGSMLGGLMNAGGSSGVLASVLGSGSNAITARLSKATGFNVTPLLGMLAPAMMSIIGKAVRASALDGAGLASLLKKEHTDFSNDPANANTMSLVDSAMAAGDQANEMISSYGAAWTKVTAGPAAVLYMVASADMSGPIGSVREAKAAHEALLAAALASEPTSLVAAAFSGGITRDQLSALKTMAPNRESLLGVVRESIAAVKTHSPAESTAFNDTLFTVATATARAAKEGGFLGIGGTLVSQDEQQALDTLKAAFA